MQRAKSISDKLPFHAYEARKKGCPSFKCTSLQKNHSTEVTYTVETAYRVNVCPRRS